MPRPSPSLRRTALSPRRSSSPTRAALIAGAADFIAAAAAEAIAARGAFTIALSGGNTPKPVYQRLASAALDWTRVHVFFGDERCVPPDDPRSNFDMARSALLDHVADSGRKTCIACAARIVPDAAAEAYADELEDARWATAGGSISSCSASATTATPPRSFPGLAAVTETRAHGDRVLCRGGRHVAPDADAAGDQRGAPRRVSRRRARTRRTIVHRVLQGPRAADRAAGPGHPPDGAARAVADRRRRRRRSSDRRSAEGRSHSLRGAATMVEAPGRPGNSSRAGRRAPRAASAPRSPTRAASGSPSATAFSTRSITRASIRPASATSA